jgi:TIR domain
MSHDVFISYSSLDKAAADATCAALERSGIRCWIAPRDIIPGKEWGDAIIEAIHAARVLVLIFSANANTSPQIRREVERAVHKGLPIIPLRIEDIAPTHSLEYFIGTVHWLDALTPPFEAHLRRLSDSVKALVQVDPDRPSIVVPAAVASLTNRPVFVRNLVLAALAVVGMGAVAMFLWSRPRSELPIPAPSSFIASTEPSPALTSAPIQATAPVPSPETPPAHRPVAAPKPPVDPRLVGTLERRGVVNGYSARYAYAIAPGGGYKLTTTLEETGTFKGGNGKYRTISSTGYVRTGAYRAVGPEAIEVTPSEGASAVFTPAETLPPLDPAHPSMLGRWRAVSIQDGLSWTWTVQNGSDGHYVDNGKAEDAGDCAFSDGHWQCVSTVSGHTSTGSYRVTDQGQIEITDEHGSLVWQRLEHSAE